MQSRGLAQQEGDTGVTSQWHKGPFTEALDGAEISVLPPAGSRVSSDHWGNWSEILLSLGNHCQNAPWLSLISQRNGHFALWESGSQKCRGIWGGVDIIHDQLQVPDLQETHETQDSGSEQRHSLRHSHVLHRAREPHPAAARGCRSHLPSTPDT